MIIYSVYEIRIQYTNFFKRYRTETIFRNWKRAITPIIIGDFTLNQTWSIFYDYISVYKIWLQYTNLFKRYWTETIFVWEVRTYRRDTIWWGHHNESWQCTLCTRSWTEAFYQVHFGDNSIQIVIWGGKSAVLRAEISFYGDASAEP